MGFFFTQLFISLSMLTPEAFGMRSDDVKFVLILGIFAVMVGALYIPSSRAMFMPQPYLVAAWVIVSAASLVPIYIGGAMMALRNEIPFAAACLLIMVTTRKLSYLTIMAYVQWALCVFIIGMAIIQLRAGITGFYVLAEGVQHADTEGTVISITNRIMGLGTIHDPNDFGQVLVTTLPLLWLRWKPKALFSNFLLTILPACVLLLGIYLTRSRGTIVALLMLTVFAFKDKLGVIGSSVIGFLMVGGMVAAGLTGGRGVAEDDGSRVALWAQCLGAFRTHPIIGVGWGQAPEFTDTHLTAHNSYVVCFTETGLVGYFFFIAILIASWMTTTNLLKARSARLGARKQENEAAGATARFPWMRPAAAMGSLPEPALASGAAALPGPVKPAHMARAATTATPPWQRGAGDASAWKPQNLIPLEQRESTPEEFEHAAFCLRLSLVALLTSMMFLSRAYSLPIYLLVAMITAVAALSPSKPTPSLRTVLKYTPVVMTLSILGLYLVIRARGGK